MHALGSGRDGPRPEARQQFVASGIACIVLLVAGVIVGLSVWRALDTRAAVAQANELKLAAATVASAEAMVAAGGDIAGYELGAAVARLSTPSERTLAHLDPEERAEADELITGIIDCGILLQDDSTPHGGQDELHDHQGLQRLLATAASRAEQQALASERTALAALLVAAAAASLVGWFLLRARASELYLRDDLQRQANTDPLTGLANRRTLPLAVDEARTRMVAGSSTGLLVLDVDGFKNLNDSLGNGAGDALLRQMAERLDQSRRASDLLIRTGSDEFLVVLTGLDSPDSAIRAASRYQELVGGVYSLEGRQEHVRLSAGVSFTDSPEHVGALNSEADLALQEAKRRGGGVLVAFDPSLETESTENGRIVRALRSAHHDSEFRLVYQPILTVDATTTLGHEALLRWTSPTLGEVGPNRFIPIAERSGEICAIGRWVIDRACRQLRTWIDLDPVSDAYVSVNVSAIQLAEEGFVDFVVDTLARWGVPHRRLVIEVTESAVLDRRGSSVQRLGELRRAGLRISIDDFGSGYSNLGQLLEVPFDILKIDRSLLETLSAMREQAGGDPASPCAIMSAIVSIASVFDAPVICEGVETEEQRRSLEVSGVDLVQGYLTGRPMEPDQIEPPGSRLVVA